MAAEASLTDQEAHKQVEVNVDDDIKYNNEDIVFRPKVLEGKEEEELKVEDTTSVEAPVIEHTPNSVEASDTSDMNNEEKNKESSGEATEKEPVTEEAEQKELSNDLSDALVEDVKKEEEEKELKGEATEKEPVSEAAEQKENSDDLSDTLVEDAKKEEETEGEFTQKESYSKTTEQKEIFDKSNDALIKPVTEEAEQNGLSNDVSDALVDDVKREEKERESEGEATEKELVSEAAEQKENSDDLSDTLVVDAKKEGKPGEFTKEQSYSEATEQKEISDYSNAALIEDVKNEEGKQEREGEATEKESDSEATEQKENSGDLIDALVEDANKKEERKESEVDPTEKEPVAEAPKQIENSGDSIDALVEDVKDEEGKKEPEDLAALKEPDSETVEGRTETTEVALIPESEAEPVKVPGDSDIKTEDHVPSTSEIKEKEVETPAVSTVEDAVSISAAPDASETPEAMVVEKNFPEFVASSEPSKEESASGVISNLVAFASDILNASPSDPEKIDEVKDTEAVVPEVADAPQNTNDKPSADDSVKDTVMEESPRGETELVIEEKATGQDSTFSESLEAGVAEIAKLSGEGGSEKSESLVETSKDIDTTTVSEASSEAEKAPEGVHLLVENKNLEGDKTTLLETSKDLVVDSSVNDDSKEADSQPNAAEAVESVMDKSAIKESEDNKDQSEKADDAKGDDQLATPVKSSQKHSNSLISKVKQSIVKVKKAIIGKSSSSKAMLQENKDDIKDVV